MSILDKIVTPKFITFQAHCWFAYAFVHTFQPHHWWALYAMLGGAAVKEFYIDKHFEQSQNFDDNLVDWIGYATGTGLALCALRYLAY